MRAKRWGEDADVQASGYVLCLLREERITGAQTLRWEYEDVACIVAFSLVIGVSIVFMVFSCAR